MTNTQQSLFDDDGSRELPWVAAPDVAFQRWIATALSPRDNVPYTALSRQQYISMWGQFCSFLRLRDMTVAQVSASILNEFIAQQRGVDGHSLAPSTVRRYLALLERVYARMQSDGVTKGNPASELFNYGDNRKRLAPAAVAHLASSLDEQFVETVKALPEQTWKDRRDKTMLLLLPGSGLTQTELLQLCESDLFLKEEVPYVLVPAHGKRDARAVSLAPFAVEALAVWMAYRKQAGIRTKELFPAKTMGGRLNASTLYRHVESILKELGIAEQRGARRLRHTFAMRQLKVGAPDEAVKDWLGLKTDEMLHRYRKLIPNIHGVTAV